MRGLRLRVLAPSCCPPPPAEIAPLPPSPVPPSILGEELNVSVVANESVALECQSHAVPPPVLSWRKDGRPLEPRPGARLSADKTLLEVCEQAGQDGPLGVLRRQLSCVGPAAPPDPTPRAQPPDLSELLPAERGLRAKAQD